MKKGLLHSILSVFLIAAFVLSYTVGLSTVSAEVDCLNLSPNAGAADRAFCQNQINDLEAQLKVLNDQLSAQKNKSGTLQSDINLLTTKIKAKQADIKAKSLRISQLKQSITEKQTAIVSLEQKIRREQSSLAQLLRETYEMDHTTLASFLLSKDSLSHFYSDVSHYDAIKEQVKDSIDTIRQVKGVTLQKKQLLEKEQDKTVDQKADLEVAKKTIEQDQATQKQLLSISKNKEAEYQKVIAEQQAKVAKIKARLFQLAGGSQAIRFDVALQYANDAAAKTGVDPAFLLAELTQESNLGSNVGKCYLTDTKTGAGTNSAGTKTYPNVMKPTRDVQPFIEITGKLGYDWQKTVVSCPIAGVAGWGGAMGPAQFIASTWKIFESRLKDDLGHYPNPWSAQDAFMASALYLADLGGVGKSTSAQLRASCKYYGSGGSTCSYGRSVQTLKTKIQADIDYLNQYGVSRR